MKLIVELLVARSPVLFIKKMASCFLLHWALQINITDSQQQLAQILFNLLRVLKQNV